MDPRLESILDRARPGFPLASLCTNAVVYARFDRDADRTATEIDNALAVYLGRVLTYAFGPDIQDAMEKWDWLGTFQKLSGQAERPQLIIPTARWTGDYCLFIISQGVWVGRRFDQHRQDMLAAAGRQAYQIVATHTNPRARELGQLYAALSHDFSEHADVLGSAGRLLGFTPEITSLLHGHQPVVTFEDFLEALSIFGREPTIDHWGALAQAATTRRHSDPNFNFVLPPRPPA